MLNRILPVFLFIFGAFAFEPGASASQVCNSISECQDAIKQAKANIQELARASGQRVSITGAVFTPDTSNLALGEAYRDPSGLIWKTAFKTPEGYWNILNQSDADKYCKALGARLPTREEYEQLAKYLGADTSKPDGYSPYLADGRTDFFPCLSSCSFWSSSIGPDFSRTVASFDGYFGYIRYDNSDVNKFAVQCVSR